ncbi:hypothetical protein CC77DRAFT_1062602 [Alternaria alternata]|uniref:Uncharacterized protein n=1 Tax=Alternaria alternata TaxID=5599 RepID=A0A177DJC6_ALTAL|nr:hypothetical protein CC77DRAFT_1062602 [Alternaria alternata]OAG19458.1 hypothetical protein CC77DRAFT_1062602 [Alternaria alternata]
MAKPPATKKIPSKNKDGSDRKSPSSIFGPHAITRYLCIPQTGNITGVELTVFLPELLRAPGVLSRFIENGADAQTLARISAWFRATVKDHHTPATAANAMRHITQATMRRYLQEEKWTETRHKAGRYKKPGQVWDHENLTFAGVQNYCEDNTKEGRHKRPPTPNVRFALLAVDVVVFPSGDDGLDLTRCVRAAAANEDLPLMFPRDYGFLTWLLDGPQLARPANQDRELFNRWRQKAATEQYLQKYASTKQSALDAVYDPMDMPIQDSHGFDVPSASGNQSPNNSLLVDLPMKNSTVDLGCTLSEMDEDDMDMLYVKWLVAHGTSYLETSKEMTSTSEVVRRYLEHNRSIHGPLPPISNEASAMVPPSDALNNEILGASYGSWPSSPMNWHVTHYDHPATPFDVNRIDIEMMRSSSHEITGYIGPEHGMRSPRVGSEHTDFDSLDDVGCAFAQETL